MKLKKVLSGFLATAMAITTVAVSSIVTYADNVSVEWISNSVVSCDKLTDVTKAAVTATVTAASGWGKTYIYCANSDDGVLDANFDMSKVDEEQTVEIGFDGSQNWYQIGYMGGEGFEVTLGKIEFQKANGDVVYTYDPALDTTPEITKVSDSKYTYTAEAKADSTSTNEWNAVTPKPLSVDLSALLPTGKTLSDVTKITVTPTVTNGSYGGAMSINIVVEGDPNYKWTSATLGEEVAAIECPLGLTESNLKLEIQWINYEANIEFDVAVECGASTVAVTGVTLDETELALKKGETADLTATVAPTNATVKTVTWASSNDEVATVSTDGKVTAVASGTATITATSTADTTKKATCTVTVTNPATAITLNKTELALKKGETDTLTATVEPTDADDEVEWTVTATPSGAVTVDQTGKVTAVKSGTATVTATAGTKSATCTVTVTTPATAIAFAKTTETVLVGATKTLAVTTTPTDADALTYTWTSSKPEVATVANGVVTGVAAGTTTITATAGDLTATCTVNVTAEAKPATAVTLNKPALDLEVEDTDTLTATLTPEDSTDSVTWTSSNTEVATVDQTGKVTAVAAGNATITATANATVKAECTVKVSAKTIAITGVTLKPTTASVEEGKTVELTATVSPADTTEDKTVTWTSSDTAVATVKDGVVTAVKAGTATITATAGTKSADCAVTVTAPKEPEPTTPDKPTASDVLWEGKTDMGTSWGASVSVDAAAVSANDIIKITYTVGSASYHQLKIMDSSWNVLTSLDGIAHAEYGTVAVSGDPYTVTLNAADAAAITKSGLVISGYDVTVTKVERVAGTATAPTGYETGKVEVVTDYVPKTAGTQLVVRSITKAEAAQNESYTITVTDSNGKKTTVTTNDCYEAFKYNTKDGAKTETAANGYFIIVKVTGVPAGTTVDVDIQPTK